MSKSHVFVTPLTGGGVRVGTISVEQRDERLKICIPGAYLYLHKEDVETLKGIFDTLHVEHVPKEEQVRGIAIRYVLKDKLDEEEYEDLVSGPGALREADLTPEEKADIAEHGCVQCWFEEDETPKG